MNPSLIRNYLFLVLLFSLLSYIACSKPPEEGTCQVNTDCKSTEYCSKSSSKCKNKSCSKDSDCLNGERCQTYECVAVQIEIVNNEKKVPDASVLETDPKEAVCAKTCSSAADCSGGACQNGCCSAPCSAQNPCKTGVCNPSGVCVECMEDIHCGTKVRTCTGDCTLQLFKVCEANQCVDKKCECATDSVCNPTSTRCEPKEVLCPDGSKPDPQGQCPKIDVCKGTTCPSGQTPDPNANCLCMNQKLLCEKCSRDAECGADSHCEDYGKGDKFCARDCSKDPNICGSDYTCKDFGTYKACVHSLNTCPCVGTTCPSGNKCCPNDGRCHDCCSDSDCKQGEFCHNVLYACQSNPCANVSCPTGSVCDPSNGNCKQTTGGSSGGTCTTDSDCGGSEVCCDMLGQKLCTPSSSCFTAGGGGGLTCTTDADCTGTQTCCDLLGTKMCMDPAGPLSILCGAGGGSKTCTSNSDCKSGEKCCTGILTPGKTCTGPSNPLFSLCGLLP